MENLRRNIKKILYNKLFLFFAIIVCLLVIGFIIYNKEWWVLYALLLILFVSFLVLYKILFNINMINIDKLKKYLMFIRYNKQIGNDEVYVKHLNINTFDGSGELTHPSVLYFKNGYRGYKYWMVHTPYSNCKLSLENPCIVVSNDGINFENIKGGKEPLLPIIEKDKPKTYYNDPNLIYTDRLEIWYRYTEEYDNKNNNHIVFRITSLDGITWTEPEQIFVDKGEKKCHMSLSIVYENDRYKYYYFNKNKVNLIESVDLTNWSQTVNVKIDAYTGDLWHGEVRKIKDKYCILFIDKKYGLYIATSSDGINFKDVKRINLFCKSKEYFYNNVILYKSSIVIDDKYIYLYVPFRFDTVKLFKLNNVINNKWYITLTKIRKNNFERFVS